MKINSLEIIIIYFSYNNNTKNIKTKNVMFILSIAVRERECVREWTCVCTPVCLFEEKTEQ